MRYALICVVLFGAAQTVTAGEKVIFTYDARGRVIAVRHAGGPADGVASTYDLDAAGNRTRVMVNGATGGGSGTGNSGGGATAAAVPDGSFETPDVGGGYQYGPSVGGMTFSDAAGVAANGSAWNFPTAPDGKQVGFLQAGGTGTITATVTNLQTGARYNVRFMAVRRPGYPVNPVDVGADGSPLGSITPQDQFADYSVGPFIAQSTTASVSLAARHQDYDAADGIDVLRVEALPTALNASFETPPQGSGYQYTPSSDGVRFDGPAGLAGNGSAWGFAAAPDGNQVAFLQSGPNDGGRITQHVVGLSAGASYAVRFRSAHRPGFGQAPVSLAVGGRTLATVSPGDAFGTYTSASFTANATSTDIVFSVAAASGDNGSAIDFIEILPN